MSDGAPLLRSGRGSAMSTKSDKLRLISGVGAKGPACFVVETAGKRIMLVQKTV